ncbi:MAG: Ycf51 family protein [Coleofasciculus chthonoplastes F3-SA18-01]|jgi:hypothetical protein|uniref:DUF2518 family protein n=1 Tax=Coleofasciculus chthonoplastes TaxID=64178 RepID=UPI0032F8C518
MPTTTDFLSYTQWIGILTLVCGVLSLLGFIFKWGIRFRLVGITGFMGVLTGGLFALSIVPFSHTVIPGAVRFTLVYDNGGNQAVIALPTTINESQLEASLRQAASDFFSYGRLGGENNQLTIRARTVIHPEPGVSKPLVVGKISRSLAERDDQQMTIDIYTERLAQLPDTST